ncbi:MAG TPA: adenylosuccinate lyase [Anaerolineales bacterium]|nr:adenylosuccinate lyase [Anaerolineales bacterium]
MSFDFETYLSPLTWRYGSAEMRQLWSEAHKRRLWRRMWVTLAEVQAEFGLINPELVKELRRQTEAVNMTRALEIEAEIHHDLMAELQVFAEQSDSAGGVLHLGATSVDIEDNTDALRIRDTLELVLTRLRQLLESFCEQIERWAETPVIAFTHLQPAEPSTLGYRLACYAQDLHLDWQNLTQARAEFRGKGFKGAVGSRASFAELLGEENLEAFEAHLSKRLGLPFYPITTQTYPRGQEFRLLSALAGLGASLYKFAFDLRVLQSPPVGELSEPFGASQVGSSAMPFKRNPINAEKINSLARLLAQMPRTAWDNAAHSLLERTLDDSANRRSLLPEAFLITDELLHVTHRIIKGLRVDEKALKRNLAIYGPFAATERLLMRLVKMGADRQVMHTRLREHALAAWQAVGEGQANPLGESVSRDPELLRYLDQEQIGAAMQSDQYTGDASKRAIRLVADIRSSFG